MRLLILFLVVLLALADRAMAQDLEPRAFSPAPVGMNFALVAYGYGTGDVFFDKSLPVQDATGQMQSLNIGGLRTFGLFGATAKLAAVLPIAWGEYKGLYQGEEAFAFRRGIADPIVNLSVNFFGAPARTLGEMINYSESTVIGAAVLVQVPLGQYDPGKLINLGANRWAVRARLGGSQQLGRWNVELIGEMWAFTQNPEAFGGVSVSQDPIIAVQTNVVYRFRRGWWAACGFGYGEGGQTTVSGEPKDTAQVNKRFGLTLAYPLSLRNSLKISYLNSLSTRIGAELDRVGIAWQYRWGGGI